MNNQSSNTRSANLSIPADAFIPKGSIAYHNARVISFACSSERYQFLLQDIWGNFLRKYFSEGLISNYHVELQNFNQPVMIVSFVTNQYHYINTLRLQLKELSNQLNKKYTLSFIDSPGLGWESTSDSSNCYINSFFLPEVSFSLSPYLRKYYEHMNTLSVDHFVALLNELKEEPVTEDFTINRVVAMQLMLSFYLLKEKEKVATFYSGFLTHILNSVTIANIDIEQWRCDYRNILAQTYENQKEIFSPFIDGLWSIYISGEMVEDSWLNEWILVCQNTAKEFEYLSSSSYKLVYTEDDRSFEEVFLQAMARSIANHHGVNASYELNLYYIFTNSLNNII